MPTLLVVGGGLFGSLAAALARSRGIEAVVFDPGLPGAASPAAAGLFREAWAGRKHQEHFRVALAVLEELTVLERITLTGDAGGPEPFLFVPPRRVLEPNPVQEPVTRVGDGWLEAAGRRWQGWVYLAAGVWSEEFLPGLGVRGRAGSAFLFAGEGEGRIQPIAHGRQALAFVRDPGWTYFSDGTAEEVHTPEHDALSLERASALGLAEPTLRLWGRRPYAPGGLVFRRLASRTWLATGGRKLGTVLGAFCARRLLEEMGL